MPPMAPYFMVYHNESIFHSNEDQGWAWAEKWGQQIKPQGQGRGIMLSDFIEEHRYLCFDDTEYETAKCTNANIKKCISCWSMGQMVKATRTVNKFIQQLKPAVKISEFKYSSGHYNLPFYLIKVVDTQLTMMMCWLYLVWMSNQVDVSQEWETQCMME